jgi:superfamily II DNA or RNA helicase
MLDYLKYIKSILSDNETNVWLWCDIPEFELKQCKMILNNEDYRIYRERKLNQNFYKKFLLLKKNNNYNIIQCIYNNKTNNLTDFYKIIKLLNLSGSVYHSINYDSIKNINLDFNIKFYKKLFYPNINSFSKYTNLLNSPYDYQIKAYETLKNQHRCILKLPCGMGKTLISMMCGLDFPQIIIIAPLRQYCKQNLDRFTSEIKYLKYITLLVDSEGTRNPKYIKNFIKMNTNIILSVTYKSVDILNKIRKYLTNYIIIIDEFHNLTRFDILENKYFSDLENKIQLQNKLKKKQSLNNQIINHCINNHTIEDLIIEPHIIENHCIDNHIIENHNKESHNKENHNKENNNKENHNKENKIMENHIIENQIIDTRTEMNKLLYSDARILFMSATPRIFDMYDNGLLNTKIFGDINYSYDMGLAIKNKYICDYDIFLPSNINKNLEFDDIFNIKQQIQFDNLIDDLDIKKCKFLIEGCLELGSKKCIIYLHTHIEAKTYKYIIKKLSEYYYIPLYVETILSVDNNINRNLKLNEFNKFYGYSFLCSVQILDECIDIQNCDSIYITYPSNSKIRNIQRLCRSNRRDPENINKRAKIFLWADENNDIVEILRHLKEYDTTFTINKIDILNSTGKINRKTGDYNNVKNFVENVKKMSEFDKIWTETLNKIKKNIKLNIKLNKNLLNWLHIQNDLFKDKDFINNNKYLFNLFYNFKSKYTDLFLSNSELWHKNLYDLENYINVYKKRPSLESNLYKWLYKQLILFNQKEKHMKKNDIYEKFKNFKENCLDKLDSFEDIWHKNFNNLILYIILNKYLPSKEDINIENKKLALWMDKQVLFYKNKENLLKNNNIYNIFDEFYKKYYLKCKIMKIHIQKKRKLTFY